MIPKRKINPQLILVLLLLLFGALASFFHFEANFFPDSDPDDDVEKYRKELDARLRVFLQAVDADGSENSVTEKRRRKENDVKLKEKKKEENQKSDEKQKEEDRKKAVIERTRQKEEETAKAAETKSIAEKANEEEQKREERKKEEQRKAEEERKRKEEERKKQEEAIRIYQNGELFAWAQESCKMFHWSPRAVPLKMFDTFTFFNEIELLLLRLHTLSDIVDHFVLVESPQTFTLQGKKLFYQDLKDTVFAKWKHKIVHVVCDLKESPIEGKVDSYESNWRREEHSRNCILKGLGGAASEDIILIGDVDEIPHPETLRSIKGCEGYSLMEDYNIVFSQLRFNYNFFCEKASSSPWRGTIALSKESVIRVTPGKARSLRDNQKGNVRMPGGWHLSNFFFNDGERAVLKIVSFSHQEHNTEENRKKEQWEKYMKSSDGCRVWSTTHHLPAYVMKYPHLFDNILNEAQKEEIQLKRDFQDKVLVALSTKSTIRRRAVFAKRAVDQLLISFPNVSVLILDEDDNQKFSGWFSQHENIFYLPSSSSTTALTDKLSSFPAQLVYFLHLRDEHVIEDLKHVLNIFADIKSKPDFAGISGRVNDKRTAWDWSVDGSTMLVSPATRYLQDTPCMEAYGFSSFYIMRMSDMKQISFDNRLTRHHQHLLLWLKVKEKKLRFLSCNQFLIQDWGGREDSGLIIWGDGEQASDSEKERAKEEEKLFTQTACGLAGNTIKVVNFDSVKVQCS